MEHLASNHRSVAKSAIHFLSGTALSRISGLARDISIAYVFGTSASIAAFLVALRFANLLRRIFGEGALLNSFVPYFEACRKENSRNSAVFFRDAFVSMFVVTFVLVMLIELLMVSAGFFVELSCENAQIIRLTAIMLPGVLFMCLFSLCSGLLHCESSYFLTGISPVAFNVIWIVSVWLVRNQTPDIAVIGLSVGVLIAFFFQWLVTVPKTVVILLRSLHIKELVKCNIFTCEMRRMLSSVSVSVIGVTAAQINTVIDTLFARIVLLEGPAYLNFAIHIQQLPLALIGISISSALLPPLSRAVRSANIAQTQTLLEFALSAAMFIVIPCSIGIFVAGGACINLIFGRGHFDQASIYHTTLCLWGYGIGLIPMVISLLLAPAFYAKKDYRTPLKASLLAIFVNLLLNILFARICKFGPSSLAIATSLSAYLNAWILYRHLLRKNEINLSMTFFYSIVQILIGSIIAGATTLLIGFLLLNDQSIPIILGTSGQYTQGIWGQLREFLCLFSLFSFVFFMCMVVFRNKEMYKIFRIVNKSSVQDQNTSNSVG